MRILVSLESDENLDKLNFKLGRFLSIIEDPEIFIDLLHVYKPPEGHKSEQNEAVIEEIKNNEHKMKLKMIAKCENGLETYLQDNLNKRSLVNSYVLEGNYKERLIKHIVFHRYDLMFLNPGKKREFNLILRGRITHWVIDNLEIPVIIMPNYLEPDESSPYCITCFVDELASYNNIQRSDLFNKFKRSNIKFVHFGRHGFHDDVEVVNSVNPLESITGFTKCCNRNDVFVLNHKNKGNFLNFLDKSFSKNVIQSLQNPLLIF